jgi:hypothetical protein
MAGSVKIINPRVLSIITSGGNVMNRNLKIIRRRYLGWLTAFGNRLEAENQAIHEGN